jgi:hypothetical protein
MAVTTGDLIVEDGTGLTTATTYVTLVEADEYHRIRGNEVWNEAADTDKVVALIRATQYVDERWVFLSRTFNRSLPTDAPAGPQVLQFPRDTLYDRNGTDVKKSVPIEIKDATCEYGLEVLGDGTALTNLSTTPDQTEPKTVSYLREKVGSLESETRYDSSRGLRIRKSFPVADRIMLRSGYLRGTDGGVIR